MIDRALEVAATNAKIAETAIAQRDEFRKKLAEAYLTIAALRAQEGHCLIQVPQETPEKPSPCAMAGCCLKA